MTRSIKFALLAAASLASALPAPLAAQSSGVQALLEQAQYWEERGRADRAAEIYRRVLAIDPDNAAAQRGLRGRPAPTPAPAPAPAPAPRAASGGAAPSRPFVAEQWRPTAAQLAGRDRAEGFEALEAGELVNAARMFESALSRTPNDAESLGGLGLVRLRTERFAEARDLLQRASRIGSAPQWADALRTAEFFANLGEARAAFDAGQLAEAQRIAETLTASGYGELAPAYQLLAAIFEQQGRLREAATMSRQAAGQGGTPAALVRSLEVDALRQEALAAIEARDTIGAEQLFQQGLLASNDDPWIRYEFARFMIDQGRVAESESLIRSLSQINGSEARYAAALLLDRLDRPAEAQAVMDAVPPAELSAEMRSFLAGLQVDATIARARTLAAGGRVMQAATSLRQTAAAPGTTPAKMAEIASLLHELGDQAGAADLARTALNAAPRDLESYEPIIRVLTQTGQTGFALAALERVEEAAGGTPQGAQLVGRLNGMIAAVQADQLREAGGYAEAFDLLQSAWNRSPGNAEVLAALARLYQTGEMPLQAAQTFQMVLQQDPDDKGAMIGLIDSATGVGEHALAERALRAAIAAHPDDYEVYLAGARLAQARGKDREARSFLERARAIYLRETGLASGGFPSANPFATRAGGLRAAAPASVNPFALGTDPQLARSVGLGGAGAPMAPGYAAPRPGAYAPAPPGAFTPPQAATFGAPPPPPPYYGGAPDGGGGFAAMAPAQPAAYQSGGDASYGGDPVLARIQQDLRQLDSESGPLLEVRTAFRDRSGEEGLSSLQQIGATATASTDLLGGRVAVSAEAVVLDAGQPAASGLARFGRNGLIEAQAIVDEEEAQLIGADTQHSSGVAPSVAYRSDFLAIDVGATPLGFEQVEAVGGIAVTPRFSPYASGRLWAERRAVQDSLVSYAGAVDPVTGQFWGAVTRTGGGASFSFERDGSGFYGDGRYHRYEGTDVRDNEGVEVNAGGYFLGYSDESSRLTFGVNANYQSYDNNQNFFTTGHGGYFSPQSFLSISFPVRYSHRTPTLELNGSVTPGYQTYEQDGEPLYPTDAAAQAALDQLRVENRDVRARYDTISETGFGFAAEGSAYYNVLPRTRIGGEINYNTFGDYNEFKLGLGVRQTVGGGQ